MELVGRRNGNAELGVLAGEKGLEVSLLPLAFNLSPEVGGWTFRETSGLGVVWIIKAHTCC